MSPNGDRDNGGISDDIDTRPDISNPGQEDSDNDILGDACDDESLLPLIQQYREVHNKCSL